MNRLIELYPAYARAWGARAVVRARLGWRDEALADVKKALELDPVSGRSQGQAAFAYAVMAPDRPADREMAFRFLGQALRLGYGWDDLADSDNFAPLRKDPRFTTLVLMSKLLRSDER